MTQIKASIKIIESLRTKVVSPDLRSSYFATAQSTYSLYIDILMSLHQQNPNAGYDKTA
ncbi:MAG TPA: tetratricopeptide repeat-containing protein, partial [Cyanobacteria bacterium UBA8543]|nr:tetratricopeptide repeat-containing protein [Cyanobacteria bacterium UBA8543]